ncbi:hypothetical protein [Methylocystis sp. S23]
MRAREICFSRLSILALAALLVFGASFAAARGRTQELRASGPTREGPWLQQGWEREDWSRAPVRGWGFSAPWDYDPVTGYPAAADWYPWGYTTPFVRVGRRCVASEINESPGGKLIRYQRVRPSHYCH